MSRVEKLGKLIVEYKTYKKDSNINEITEGNIRIWLNEFLKIFDWDVKNINQIQQEQTLEHAQKEKLQTIDSTHTRPDYTLKGGKSIKTFLDAKSLKVNIFTDKESAFQVKSYGWSANVPCAFISNFEQFVIFDCRHIPGKNQDADIGAIQISIDEYIDKFELLERHLLRENIINNELYKIYKGSKLEGNKQLDKSFNDLLSRFRLVLAKNLIKNNDNIKKDMISLNYYTQVILDRIIFIRVCESKGLEEQNLLKRFLSEGFWNKFKSSCYMEFYDRYDGALFSRDDRFQDLVVDNDIFNEFISKLYYPHPYRFNVIPVNVIANVYEDFLTHELVISGDNIITKIKDDYVRSNGVVATPEYLVRGISKAIFDLNHINTIDKLLELKILDPCCGSGLFSIVAYELLAEKAKEILSSNKKQENNNLYKIIDDEIYLTVKCRQEIIKNCIFGIDYDEVAVEVTKMSLALKVIDDCNLESIDKIGLFGNKILKDIHKNILLGNTLVSNDIELDIEETIKIKSIDIYKSESYKDVFKKKEGFDYIIGNPPYVETKHYKSNNIKFHKYLSEKYDSFEGKADLSVLFIERCISLLNPRGRLGFIIQRRWFKTDYGYKIRSLISNNYYLHTLIDIQTSDLFVGRTVYPSIMVLDKSSTKTVNYLYLKGSPIDVKTFFEISSDNYRLLPTSYFKNKIWSPESYEIEDIKFKLSERYGNLRDVEDIRIKDGIQALYKKVYHFKRCKIEGDYIIGENGLGEIYKLEKGMMKPIIYNEMFYPFKKLAPSAYCIFPYNGEQYNKPISLDNIKIEYPEIYKYLLQKENYIKQNVKYISDNQYWHCFTRVHNHSSFIEPKIIIPMTSQDTIATLELEERLYMDNANVWFMTIENADDVVLKAITALVNSTIFSVLGKSGANPQANGYYKFNKQFLTPIPFNKEILNKDNKVTIELAQLYDKIKELQQVFLKSNEQHKQLYENHLRSSWSKLDDICYGLYGVNSDERNKVESIGRTVDRIKILR